MGLSLKKFQTIAANTIANRYSFYAHHPERPHKGPKPQPFFQLLSAITGAGKTAILAEAISQMRGSVDSEPIVFWMSKAKSVVAQTFSNFTEGGKYAHIIEGYKVITIPQLTPHLISDGSSPLLIVATTGLFNQEGQEEGGLNIYKKDQDKFGEKSAWERLIERSDGSKRRPLFVVYDEGHNFSEQQAKLLKQLEPDAYLVASATLKLPESFERDVVRKVQGWFDECSDASLPQLGALDAIDSSGRTQFAMFASTSVASKEVVEEELIKKAIQFDGTIAPMEQSVDALIDRFRSIEAEIKNQGLFFKPKAIYVSKTNMVGNDADDHTRNFEKRQAAPIRIWRHLVDHCKIDPATIAVYANLKFSDDNKPDAFNLFSKGENDFEAFSEGNYQHIIFNQALQEGWDDPACYLAYIDKSMGSTTQVEQIIGRVLRQFNVKHYDNANLNSAHFFLRVDDENVFTTAIKDVKRRLAEQGSPIEIVENFGGSKAASIEINPRDDQVVELHKVMVLSDQAEEAIEEIIQSFPHFDEGSLNAIAEAKSGQLKVHLDDLTAELEDALWTVKGHTNPVRLRWLLSTAIRARSAQALAATNTQDPRFDVLVQMRSIANIEAEKRAKDIVAAYFQHSELVYESHGANFKFGSMRVPVSAQAYKNGLYERYGKMNNFEEGFVDELDATGHVWHRNPSAGGFHIPLLSEGETGAFYPDFIVWKGGLVYCLDTKGKHLLTDAIARKLFDISDGEKTKLHVRFISEGHQSVIGGKAVAGGYTVWKLKQGTPTPIPVKTMAQAAKECLKP
ncbi:hypothetical protein CS062_03570 [Roseateles chitinivorans]|uniref:Helicase/UvrB N-terminal domain-containing protein n=1 Tax=Roseateles chitinivorans TaxID=2917965 RepID=A0A2G9CE58_9BURK|nr:DEAD/DEAH box helicase family protein [Roseateles chitinivorans]PIM54703.1 hypothetical protein CS062_03570 [Roseateles chitinivorans]